MSKFEFGRGAAASWATLGLLLLGSIGAQADDQNGEAEPLEEYVEVDAEALPQTNTIGTKLPADLQKTPAHVGVVGSELMWEQTAVTIGDALRNVSGVNQQTQSGTADVYFVRGFDSLNAVSFLVDGVIEPEVSYYPLYNAEGVEVLKGPAGFLYGNSPFHGAVAGAVNMVRKQPMSGGDFGMARLGGGSFDTYDTAIDLNLAVGDNAAFRLNGFYQESDNFRDRTASSFYAANPSFMVQLSDRSKLNINFEAVRTNFVPDNGVPVTLLDSVDRENFYGTGFDFSDQEIFRGQVDFEHQLSDRWMLRNKTYFRSLEWLTTGSILSTLDFGVVPLVGRTPTGLDDDQTLIGNQFELVATFESGRVRHRALFGVEVFGFDDEFTLSVDGSALVGGLFDFVPANDPQAFTGVTPTLTPVQAGDTTTEVASLYVIDQIVFSEQFQATIGARLDDISFEDDGNAALFIPATDRSDSEVSPMAGLVYSPNDTWSFYANGGQTFSPAGPRVIGPQDPQESTQYEIGVKSRFADGRVRVTAAVFDIQLDNIPIPTVDGFTQQAGDQESQGFELEVAADLANGWRLFGAFAYTDAELARFAEAIDLGPGGTFFQDFSGNTPAFAPEQLVNTWISKRIGRGLTLGGGVRHVSEQFIDEDNAFEIDAYTLVDAMASWETGPWRFKLALENVTDEDYESRGFGSGSVIPMAGFAARGDVEYRF